MLARGLLIGTRADDAPTAAPLSAVRVHRNALHVTVTGDSNEHILFRYEVFFADLFSFRLFDPRSPLVAVFVPERFQLQLDDRSNASRRDEDIFVIGNFL